MRERHQQKKLWRTGLYGILMLVLSQLPIMAHAESAASNQSTEDGASHRSSNNCSSQRAVPLLNAMCKETEASLAVSPELWCHNMAGYAWMQTAVAGNPTALPQMSVDSAKALSNHAMTTRDMINIKGNSRDLFPSSSRMWQRIHRGDSRKKLQKMSTPQHRGPLQTDSRGPRLPIKKKKEMPASLHIHQA